MSQQYSSYAVFDRVPHECGGDACRVNGQLVHGWNYFCCMQCGEAYWRFIDRICYERVIKNTSGVGLEAHR